VVDAVTKEKIMLNLLKFVDARLGEPSTWASLAGMLAMVNINVDPGVLHTISLWGAVGAAVLGVLIAETGSGKTTAQIATDAFNTLVAAIKAMPPAAPVALIVALAVSFPAFASGNVVAASPGSALLFFAAALVALAFVRSLSIVRTPRR
jgi:hypothetical protein